MKTINYSNLARLTSVGSFIIGTLFFLAFQTSHNFDLVSYGLIYILIAAIVNSLVLLTIIYKAMFDEKNRVKLLAHALLMLLNIPIVFLYIYFL